MTAKFSHSVLVVSLAAALGLGYGTAMAQSSPGSSDASGAPADQAKPDSNASQAGQTRDGKSTNQSSGTAGKGATGMSSRGLPGSSGDGAYGSDKSDGQMSGSAASSGTPSTADTASDGSGSPEDQSITRQVKEALESEGIKSEEVTVETRDGVVTIRGDLSGKDLKKVKQVTKDLDGVKDVKISDHKTR